MTSARLADPPRRPASRRLRPSSSSFATRLGGVAGVALAIRLVYSFALAPTRLGADAYWYTHVARSLAQGHGYVDAWTVRAGGPQVASAMFPPLWPALLTPAALLDPHGTVGFRLTAIACGVATVVLVGLLARRVAGDRAGLVAAGLAAVWPGLVAADGSLMSESLFVALVVGAVLALDAVHRDPAVGRCALLGLLLGAAALVRTEALLLAVLLVVPLCLRLELPAPDRWLRGVTEARSYLFDRWRADPARGVVAVGARVARVWGAWDPVPVARYEATETRRFGWQLAAWGCWLLVLPFAALGLDDLGRRRVARWPLLVPLLSVTLVTAASYGNPRFRLPAEPFVLVLAASGLVALAERRSASRPPRGREPA